MPSQTLLLGGLGKPGFPSPLLEGEALTFPRAGAGCAGLRPASAMG